MKEKQRPIVFFEGNVSPRQIFEVIGKNFYGDIVVNGSLADTYSGEDTHTIISTRGGSLYLVDGGIYLYNEVSIEADVFIEQDINADEPLTIHGSLYCFDDTHAIEANTIYISENLYMDYETYMEVDRIIIGGDFCLSINTNNFPADIGGKVVIE